MLSNAIHLYRLRVREQPLQEFLALLGIAVGVALLYAVQVAGTSVTGSYEQIAKGVTGRASIEVATRSSAGFDQEFVRRAQSLPAVRTAAPLIQYPIAVDGPKGRAPMTLVGVDRRLERAGGQLVRKFIERRRDLESLGLFLTSSNAEVVGVRDGDTVTIEADSKKREELLAGTIGSDEIGDLAQSPIAIAPLGMAQAITAMPGRVTRVLIEPKPGQKAAAYRQLRTLAGDELDVRASDSDVERLAQALQPDKKSSMLFSAIAVVIGMLFAYNALLLAMARRRQIVAYLRLVGADRQTIVATLAFEAVVLGVVASVVGVLLGEAMSRVAFQSIPRYLTAGFPIGEQRVVGAQTVLLSVACGMAAAFAASLIPARDLFRLQPGDAVDARGQERHSFVGAARSKMSWAGLVTIAAGSVLAFAVPTLTPVAMGAIIGGIALVIVPATRWVLSAVNRVTRVRGPAWLAIAVDELSGAPVRAGALALIAAGSMIAMLGIGGARLDVKRGAIQLNEGIFQHADLWVLRGEEENAFLTRRFGARSLKNQLRRQPCVDNVGVLYGTFLDFGNRRVLVAAHPVDDPNHIVPNQVVKGDVNKTLRRLSGSGWIVISDPIARELGVHIGERVTIPTPSGPHVFRLAATGANYGWPSGAMNVSNADFVRYWDGQNASALAIDLKPSVSVADGRQAIRKLLGADTALVVETPNEAVETRAQALVQGLSRLRQISILVLIAAILAIVAAMFAAVWQRRGELAALRAIGMYRGEVYRALYAEMTLIVLLGGMVGLGVGLFVQFFVSGWNATTSGYFTPYAPAFGFGVITLLEMLLLTALATAGPAYLAARVSPQTHSAR